MCDWFPTHYTNDTWGYQCPETNHAKGFIQRPYQRWGNKCPVHQLHTLICYSAHAAITGNRKPSVFTGNPIEETLYPCGYCMGIPHVGERYNHALNTDYLTTYTIITPNFSYTVQPHRTETVSNPQICFQHSSPVERTTGRQHWRILGRHST